MPSKKTPRTDYLNSLGLKSDGLLVLVKGEVELPSDLNGVLYYEYKNTPEEAVPAKALSLLVKRCRHRS